MTIVTTPGPDANAYADVAALKDYADLRGLEYPEDDAVLAAGLIRTAAWLDGHYHDRLPGVRATAEQSLAWPRKGARDRDGYPVEGVPLAVVHANAAAALFDIANPGRLQRTYTPSEQKVLTAVGPIRWTVVDSGLGAKGFRLVLPEVENLLAGLLIDARAMPAALVV